MNEEVLKQMIKNQVESSLKDITGFQYVPFHLHNGIDSPQVPMGSLVGVYKASVTYDPPNLADGAGTTTTVTVAQANLGDFAFCSFSNSLLGITVTAYVSATNTVSVRFQNETGGAVDLASGTLSVFIIKKF